MSTWRFLWALYKWFKWTLLIDLLGAAIVLVGLQNLLALGQRELFNELTGDSPIVFGVWALCALLVALVTARFVVNVMAYVLGVANDFMLAAGLRQNVFAYLISRRETRLPDSPSEAVSRFRGDATAIAQYLVEVNYFVAKVLFSISALFIMARVDPLITIGAFLPLIAIMSTASLTRKLIEDHRRKSREAAGEVSGYLGEMFGTVEAIKVAGAESKVLSEFSRVSEARKRATLKDTLLTRTMDGLFVNVENVGTGIVFIVASQAMIGGSFTVGDLSLFIFYLTYTATLGAGLGHLLTGYQRTNVAIDRLSQIVPDEPIRSLTKQSTRYWFLGSRPTPTATKTKMDILETLEMRNLTYIYPDSDKGIKGVGFTIKRGTITVVTGRTGSGKSTVLRALLGSVPLHTGKILWNGRAVGAPDSFFVPPRSAYSPQVPGLFSDEIRANILLGLPEMGSDMPAAIHFAVLEEDLKQLSHGLETVVGPRGVKLSGGQRRRVGLARAIVRDPELLILDDPSGGLDVETERILWNRLLSRKQTTTLIASHRRLALTSADHIVVLRDGQIVSEGDLETLLDTCTEMQRLWELGYDET